MTTLYRAPVITDEQFTADVLQSPMPVAVLFCMNRFKKCQSMFTRWDDLAREFEGRLRVVRVVVDTDQAWAREFGLDRLPATLWFRDGREVQRAVGLLSPAALRERAEALLEGREPRVAQRRRFSSASGPVTLTDATFDEALQSDAPVLVDFWAPWCGPCHMIAPVIKQLAEEMGERALIGKLNIDENQATAQRYRVMSIPTMIIYKNGAPVDTLVGVQPAPVIRERLNSHL